MESELKDLYYLGFFTRVVSQAPSVKTVDDDLEFMVLRSRLALNQVDFVLNATRSQSNPMHKGIHLLALASKAKSRDDVERILQDVDESAARGSALYAVSAGIVNLVIDRFTETLEVLNGVDHSEAAAVRIQALLSINRTDLAEAELAFIAAPIQQTACRAFIGLRKGEEAARNALHDFQDFAESFGRYGESSMLATRSSCLTFCWARHRGRGGAVPER